jgi:hypothetical protein
MSKGNVTEKKRESRTQGHGDIWTWEETAEVAVLDTVFSLNKLYRGNTRKFIMSHII